MLQKISRFNQVLTDIVSAEEDVGDTDTRVFTKIRREFSNWKTELENKAFQCKFLSYRLFADANLIHNWSILLYGGDLGNVTVNVKCNYEETQNCKVGVLSFYLPHYMLFSNTFVFSTGAFT